MLQRYYAVGPDWQFVSKRIDFSVVNLEAFTDTERAPPEGILRLRVSGKRHRRGVLHEVAIEFELTIDGVLGGVVFAEVIVLPRKTYKRLRAQQRKHKALDSAPPRKVVRPIDSACIGRIFHRNVAIGDRAVADSSGDCRYTAIVDQRNPCFFDHPLDHVPGALIVEIYRQAAIATATPQDAPAPLTAVTTRCDVKLSDFAELEARVECCTSVVDDPAGGPAQIVSTLHQLDKQIGEGHVELRFVPVSGHA